MLLGSIGTTRYESNLSICTYTETFVTILVEPPALGFGRRSFGFACGLCPSDILVIEASNTYP